MTDFTDAITIERNRRVMGDIAVPIEQLHCGCDFVMQQVCDCLAEPNSDITACSECGMAYRRVK